MDLTNITPAASEPLTLAEVKDHLRILDNDHDTLLSSLITAATSYLDTRHGILGRALITQTWEMRLLSFSDAHRSIKLPYPPLQSVISVKYIDSSGQEQIIDAADYIVNIGEYEGTIRPANGKSWPATTSVFEYHSVSIRFVCGFGDDPTDVPQSIRQAMLLIITDWYENRADGESCASQRYNNRASDALLAPYRLPLVTV